MDLQPLDCIKEEKEFLEDEIHFPNYAEKKTEYAVGKNSNIKYLFDVNRGRIELKKITLQNRMQKTIILLRLDIGAPPHSNPPKEGEEEGQVLHGPHLHVYSDKFGDSMAYTLDDPMLKKINPKFDFSKFNTENHIELYESFLEFCQVTNPPTISQQFL